MIPCRESDGIGATLQKVVCAWCGKGLGAQACVPEMANTVSHGMCPACSAEQRAKSHTLVHGGRLEAAASLTWELPSGDAGSPAPSFGTVTPRPLFWCVTGHDFKRSNDWARRHGNPVADQIRDHKRRMA